MRGRNYKGVKKIIDKTGYILIFEPKHPLARKNGYVAEHRMVWYKHHKKLITPRQNIHHKNENKRDNRIENLELLDVAEHAKRHYKGPLMTWVYKKCLLCEALTASKYTLCRKHYRNAWFYCNYKKLDISEYHKRFI